MEDFLNAQDKEVYWWCILFLC